MYLEELRESHPVKVGLRHLYIGFIEALNPLRESHPVKVGLRLPASSVKDLTTPLRESHPVKVGLRLTDIVSKGFDYASQRITSS